MRTDKELAFTLRKQGKSYREIHNELGMSVSTLSNWFKGVDFSEEIKKSLTTQSKIKSTKRLHFLNKVRGDLLAAHYEQAKKEALEELENNLHNPLFIAVIAAYWGEGDKLSRNHVRLTNTDPAMLRMFVTFLKNYSHISMDRVSLALFIYKDLDNETSKKYWANEVGITKFHKTQVLPSRHKTRRLPYGTCAVILTDSYLKRKMSVWIDQMPKMVLNMVPSETIKYLRP